MTGLPTLLPMQRSSALVVLFVLSAALLCWTLLSGSSTWRRETRTATLGARFQPGPDANVGWKEPGTDRAPLLRIDASTIEGVCSDWKGRPIVPVPTVSVTDASGRHILSTTDEAGAYRIACRAGIARVECSALGHASEAREVALGDSSSVAVVDFVLEPLRTVEVRLVTPAGESFAAEARRLGLAGPQLPVLVPHDLAESDEILAVRRGTTPDVWGAFTLPESAAAEVGARIGDVELSSARVQPASTRAELVIAPSELFALLATLSVRAVRATDGLGLDGATAWLELERGRVEAARGAEGELCFASVPPGRVRLWVAAPGFELLGRELHLHPGASLDLGALSFGPALFAAGRTTDEAGRACSAVLEVRSSERDDAAARRIRSAADGTFEIGGLGSGRWRLTPVGHPNSLEFALRDSSRSDLQVVVESGR